MKKIISISVICMLAITNSHAQQRNRLGVVPQVRVVDWEKRAVILAANWGSVDSANLVRQIGIAELEQVMKYGNMYGWPNPMSPMVGFTMADPHELNKRLSQLKMYQVAVCTYTTRLGIEYEQAVLRVPYSENKDWMPGEKWDVVYFVIDAAAVEKKKPGETPLPDPVPAKITSWDNLVYGAPGSYWEKNKAQLIRQIGPYEFERLKVYSSQENWPVPLLSMKEKDLAQLRMKYDSLKLYRIATYTHTTKDGRKFNAAVLRASYQDNREWDKKLKWRYIYFVVIGNADEVVKPVL